MTNPNTIHDAAERLRALDPTQSFIVQAPAGSGKTELLTQRFLKLLALVNFPEEILAITFTKKSAEEMRARIVNALQIANIQPEPTTSHEKQTWQLAKNVLLHDKKLEWHLLENPNRLRIQTIDSFNATLTKHLPILSQFGSTPDIATDPHALYRTAVQELLSHLEENVAWSDAIAQLLSHLDNDINQVQELLINMLAKRDQWLPYITVNAQDENLREKLERQLCTVVTDILQYLHRVFPNELREEFLHIVRYAAYHLPHDPVHHCKDLTQFPGTSVKDFPTWQSIVRLFLTNEDWRKKLDKNIGFPPDSAAKNKEEKLLFSSMKKHMQTLLEILQEKESLRLALIEVSKAPESFYQEHQWQTLKALHDVLRIAVAQLKLVFQTEGKIDYIENSQAALLALGTDEHPTDLALALDYQIKHILIDEFQDTSNSQYRLLEKLIANWETNDQRTLFLVGDPMQSIYRFREAEVGLFIRARKNGIGNIKLEPLTLSVNFRSSPKIVDWVNHHFNLAFPACDDIATGAVSFSKSVAHKSEHTIDTVELHPFMNAENAIEANAIAQQIQFILKNHPNDSIAILVRSRTHLVNIIPALKSAGIFYSAIDIDPLLTRPAIQDVMALTRALIHPGDRIAWLSVLRAPWCGLTLADLLKIAGSDANCMLIEQINKPEILNQLTNDGQKRLQTILPIINAKFAERARYNLRIWVESTWLLLGGPATLTQTSDLDDINAYFTLLEELEQGGDLIHFDRLEEHIQHLFASPQYHAETRLQIMTVHNAKGLEFDHVILPQLDRKSPYDQKQLLLWMERPRENNASTLVLAPIHPIEQESDSIYEYIKRQHYIKSDFEVTRLLYVAATRAKKSLHLYFNLRSSENSQKEVMKPVANSLLAKIWPAIKSEVTTNIIQAIEKKPTLIATESSRLPCPIQRFSLDWNNPIMEQNLIEKTAFHQKMPGFMLSKHNPKLIGTALHQLLQQACHTGLSFLEKINSPEFIHFVKIKLKQVGMLNDYIPEATQTILHALQQTAKDGRGRWILSPHKEAFAEYALTAVINGTVQSLVLDRTFVDENNIRWIIDYKTSAPNGESLENFLQAEQEKYQEKLSYYHAAISAMDTRPIRLALYFPLISAWREWSAALSPVNL